MASIHDSIFYPYYQHATKVQQALYDAIFPFIERGEKEVHINLPGTSKDAFSAVKAIYNDHPELFYMDGSSEVLVKGNAVVTVKPGYNSLHLLRDAKKKALQKVVDSYLSEVQGKPVLEREKLLHDRMVKEISYQHNQHDQTAYAALVEKKAVCAGYSRAFQLLMIQMKIPCYYVSGTANGKGKFEPHAWNLIRMNGEWCNVDVTWNDCFEKVAKDVVDYTYFNATDATISKNHKRDADCAFLPKCTSDKYTILRLSKSESIELETMKQVGLTSEKPVKTKQDFISVISKELAGKKKGKYKVAIPLQGNEAVKKNGDWFKEAMKKPGMYTGSWKYSGSMQDFKNGWYRLELEIHLM